ncbi:hypothetical protein O1611_g9975 [Lasiodiplodia mahajangana]|uniref:Uncharacterized protein n=1 Tax=Lasiodiplodia mahajangana TaxID=1108764 RepID=A0ACC2J387_9PEZI|nr:hypothetical protein O1611_g9975 [Lasiodiplodia mahajangana]
MPRGKPKAAGNINGFDLDEPDGQFVTASRTKKSKLSRLEEYDEDPGRAGSQKYQRLANLLETCTTKEAGKSKAFLKEFRRDVRRKEMEVNAFKQKKEEEFTKDQEKLGVIFKHLSQQFLDGDGQSSIPRKEDHPLFKLMEDNKEDHQSVLKQFKLVEEELDANELELPEAQWKQDRQEIRDLLNCSGRYGEALIGSVLAPESAPSPTMDQSNGDEKDERIKELFSDTRELVDGETWGHVAETQLKYFAAIASTLQLEEEG